MPRKTPPPGEGRVAPPQEGGVFVEKKKVDAAFWEKFKEFKNGGRGGGRGKSENSDPTLGLVKNNLSHFISSSRHLYWKKPSV